MLLGKRQTFTRRQPGGVDCSVLATYTVPLLPLLPTHAIGSQQFYFVIFVPISIKWIWLLFLFRVAVAVAVASIASSARVAVAPSITAGPVRRTAGCVEQCYQSRNSSV